MVNTRNHVWMNFLTDTAKGRLHSLCEVLVSARAARRGAARLCARSAARVRGPARLCCNLERGRL
jgi:hypothetical protein